MTETLETSSFHFPDEPSRFEPRHIEALLVYSHKIQASDITIQTGSKIFVEVFGRLHSITHRKLSNTEVGELLNDIYGPNGTTQLMRCVITKPLRYSGSFT